jgi:ABC-type multidrug transport system fused ATPase/permease subunit
MSLLELERLQAGYGPVSVLRDIDLQIAPGDVVGVLGANGAGKSTLMRAVAGLIPCQRGRILLDGLDIAAYPLAGYRRRIGVVLQDPFLFTRSIEENIRLGRSGVGRDEVRLSLGRPNVRARPTPSPGDESARNSAETRSRQASFRWATAVRPMAVR